jgi:hypothetical protein
VDFISVGVLSSVGVLGERSRQLVEGAAGFQAGAGPHIKSFPGCGSASRFFRSLVPDPDYFILSNFRFDIPALTKKLTLFRCLDYSFIKYTCTKKYQKGRFKMNFHPFFFKVSVISPATPSTQIYVDPDPLGTLILSGHLCLYLYYLVLQDLQ